jgi:hypothetical protein
MGEYEGYIFCVQKQGEKPLPETEGMYLCLKEVVDYIQLRAA